MTLTEKSLRMLQKSMRIRKITDEQEIAVLERFSTEPKPYEWTEQDIFVQIQNYLGCGEFIKSVKDKRGTSPQLSNADF